MSLEQAEIDFNTDSAQEKSSSRQGKGSKQKRQDTFQKKKNKETDNAIMAGIFKRLKITDPTAVSSLPLASDIHPVTVPISFARVPEFVDRVWDTMEAIGTRPFSQLNTPENKNIFKKGVLILNEVKVCYAQRAHNDKPDEELPSKKLYNTEELNDLNNMASTLPLPIAVQVECVGNTVQSKQLVTPLLAVVANPQHEHLSGAITYAPRQMVPLLRILRAGVPRNAEVHQLALSLGNLPMIMWEEYDVPGPPEAAQQYVRLSQLSYDFWIDGDPGRETIRWTDREYRIFTQIVQSLSSKKGFNITTDLSHGFGSLAQVVQIPRHRVDRSCSWFTMCEVSEYDIKLGTAFGFSYYAESFVQPSRFAGSFTTAYQRGEITPRRVLNAILAGLE